MRVNISYSIELDDVPQEVDRILVECENKIRAIQGGLHQTISKDPLVIIKEVDEIRLNLGAIDLRLEDCMQILNGYVQALAQLPLIEHGSLSPPDTAQEETKE